MFNWQAFRIFKSTKTKPLMTVFAVYIGVLFVYAGLYYAIYLKSPDAYIFSADIARDQQTRFIAEHRQAKQELERESQALAKLQQALIAGLKPVQDKWGLTVHLPPYTFEFLCRIISDSTGVGELSVEVSEPGKDSFTRSSQSIFVSVDPSSIREEKVRPFVDEQLGKVGQALRKEERLSKAPEKDLIACSRIGGRPERLPHDP
jgi:hypothetical protein